jgi:adenylosuccinate lyase
MEKIWDAPSRFRYMLEVEKAVAKVQANLGMIPRKAALDIQKKSKFQMERIEEIEKETKHDVIAFVTNVAENVGPNGRFVHYGLTSSDVLDTALSLQIRDAGELLLETLEALIKALFVKANKYKNALCAGRTHGMHAEPTTFGYKLLGYLFELKRDHGRLEQAIEQISVVKLSGAVGTYSAQSEAVEKKVGELLKLTPETVATQVVPRDRHAQVILALAQLGASLERLAVELRHLQRTEVGEVVEGFTPGQKGSSAMPHKKNPISAENITGLSRMLRSYASIALENVALWHERDISHSSAERVMFPDAFILADYACARMTDLIKGLYVDTTRMKENLDISQGQTMSSHVLLALVDKGLSREDAYKLVQSASHSLKKNENLLQSLKRNKEVMGQLKVSELQAIFSGKKHIQSISGRFQKLSREAR